MLLTTIDGKKNTRQTGVLLENCLCLVFNEDFITPDFPKRSGEIYVTPNNNYVWKCFNGREETYELHGFTKPENLIDFLDCENLHPILTKCCHYFQAILSQDSMNEEARDGYKHVNNLLKFLGTSF